MSTIKRAQDLQAGDVLLIEGERHRVASKPLPGGPQGRWMFTTISPSGETALNATQPDFEFDVATGAEGE